MNFIYDIVSFQGDGWTGSVILQYDVEERKKIKVLRNIYKANNGKLKLFSSSNLNARFVFHLRFSDRFPKNLLL